ncbi:hypothetical protein BHE74_00055319 [Ensete ventricosum]|nr:hypothetical protein BHE74_00055319 [Ensete ventricosum]
MRSRPLARARPRLGPLQGHGQAARGSRMWPRLPAAARSLGARWPCATVTIPANDHDTCRGHWMRARCLQVEATCGGDDGGPEVSKKD